MDEAVADVEYYVMRARKASQAAFELPDGIREQQVDNGFPTLGNQRKDTRRDVVRKVNTESLMVNLSSDRNNYADKLRGKREIQPERNSRKIDIDNIKCSRQGQMVIVIRNQDNKLQELKALVAGTIEDEIRASLSRNAKTRIVTGMDALTTSKEVEDAMGVAPGEDIADRVEIQHLGGG